MSATMDLDKPLADIIASNPKARRGGRRRGAPGGVRARYAEAAPKAKVTAPSKPVASTATKIIISNLPADVTEAAIRDLMQSTVGPVRSVQMVYTATGKNTGQATVIFKNKGDANKAYAAYHNRMIDNQRPMKVELALDPTALVSLASRVTPAPVTRGIGSARRGRPRTRNTRPALKTAEQLDAEMTAYKTQAA